MEGPFNDIHNWNFSELPKVLGGGLGFFTRTVGEVRNALDASLANRDGFSIIEVDLDPYDISPALVRLGRRLGKRVKDAQRG